MNIKPSIFKILMGAPVQFALTEEHAWCQMDFFVFALTVGLDSGVKQVCHALLHHFGHKVHQSFCYVRRKGPCFQIISRIKVDVRNEIPFGSKAQDLDERKSFLDKDGV